MSPAAAKGALDSIGRTPCVELTRLAPRDGARILLKLESHNPTGSMKDRMARAVIEGAVSRGQLKRDGFVVEYTGGSTGTSLAFVCAALGYPATIVTSDAAAREKRDQMRAYGARVVELQSDNGRTTKDLIQRMIARATEISREPGAFFCDQFNNPDAADGYASMVDELWEQSGHALDVVIQSVGTAQCILGISRRLKAIGSKAEMIAVEPSESAVLSGGAPGAHRIEGVGPGFVAPVWRREIVRDIATVSTDDAKAMARRLAKEEGIFAGTSTGGNIVAAIREAERLGAGRTVATVACDSGLKYLSTDLYGPGAPTA